MYNEKIEDVINSVKADASSTISQKIDVLVGICESQIERGSSDFSVTMIGKLFKKQGGVAAQAIRNKTGAKYKAVISAFEKYHGMQLAALNNAPNSNLPDWVVKITDSNARWLVKDLIEENARLTRTLQAHKIRDKEHAQLVDMRPKFNAPTLVTKALDDFEVKLLSEFFSEDNLEQLGLAPDERGCLVDSSEGKRAITPPGFIDIINKLCGYDSQGNSLALKTSVKRNKNG
ncbi:gamma-mobile-trio protein GmtX [Colwellia psychrerythraea]|uniref:Uncharacterized protein n=1 Tax=Colwellia psychrerythraea (strain 34H / ATCC BAA-681) TaxID=167879 RepID=Q48AF9_COLP3|nr:gamma-mobile-trio protein GmtX [Colwellia psychrerythraea]AAZ25834.1 hypothetical protein CPS_0186 [Colwellia psychrerythraea 34H]